MIEFKTLSYKNIQSVGNYPIVIELDRSPNTLVGGANGSGKSTMLYAFAYCLYGKFLSGLKLADAINSVNKKNLRVEITFVKNGSEYKVVRGEKPKVFEIYKDGEMFDKDAHARDQQAKLEVILGMDFKLFTQIIVLNKERYVPFMDLPAGDRRQVVEDILDINVFSYMNDVVKEKVKANQDKQSLLHQKILLTQSKIDAIDRMVRHLNQEINEEKKSSGSELTEYENEFADLEAQIKELENNIDESVTLEFSKVQKQTKEMENILVLYRSEVVTKRRNLNSLLSAEDSNCRTCGQLVSVSKKKEQIPELEKELEVEESKLSDMEDIYAGQLETFNELKSEVDQIQEVKNEIRHLSSKQSFISTQIAKLEQGSKIPALVEKLNAEQTELEAKTKELSTLKSSHDEAIRDGEQLAKMKLGLNDTGIKSGIISEYIGLINQKLNEYLGSMEFYVNITFDEGFKETFNSINREKFTMANLSTGQKMRVNIAIWLALLEVATMKNSVVTNVLFLDEILENIDGEGVGHVVSLFKEKLSEKSIFVISQRFNEFEDLFYSTLQFKLVDGFTEIQS